MRERPENTQKENYLATSVLLWVPELVWASSEWFSKHIAWNNEVSRAHLKMYPLKFSGISENKLFHKSLSLLFVLCEENLSFELLAQVQLKPSKPETWHNMAQLKECCPPPQVLDWSNPSRVPTAAEWPEAEWTAEVAAARCSSQTPAGEEAAVQEGRTPWWGTRELPSEAKLVQGGRSTAY